MRTRLTESQRRHLRGLAHPLKPCVHVGGGGVSAAVLAELSGALDCHELLKVKIRAPDRQQRDDAVNALVHGTGAELVGRIGNIAILYRASTDAPRISLPGRIATP